MHPQTYLQTFWRLELKPRVFVAMSLDPRYSERFTHVIAPAIRAVQADNVPLEPFRVDISKSGDSILTDISDGVAHSRLVLGDVSTVGKDSVTGKPYRNGNVMYEIGLALACRHPSEVLLIRDDRDHFLFDVSTVPHLTIDFASRSVAVESLHEALSARLREQQFHRDARVQIAVASLSAEEVMLLKQCSTHTLATVWGREVKGIATWYALATARLLDKGLIKHAGEFADTEHPKPAFQFTQLGVIVKDLVNGGMRQFHTFPSVPAEDPPAAGA
jgi:hypothetical protein